MLRLTGPARHETVIKKSRFLALAAPVASEEEARAFFASHRDAAANHHCWAWRIGGLYRFSDDGEPGGTAGKPILQAIDGQTVDHVAVVVIRWFGGILLGSGGLMRAYGGAAAECLRLADKAEHVERITLSIGLGFSDRALVVSRLARLPQCDIAERFTETGVILDLSLPAAAADDACRLARDLTQGRAALPEPA